MFNTKVIIIIILTCSFRVLFGQNSMEERSVIIYSSKNTFLLPQIESTLKDLKNANSGKNIFNKIINFNRIEDNLQLRNQITTRASFLNIERLVFNINKAGQLAYGEISKSLQDYNLLLFIEVNTVNSILEYQITLYNTIKKENSPALKTIPVVDIENYKSISFFIDPTKDYNYVLENSIKKLFTESNRPPIAKITYDNIDSTDVLLGLGESLTLDALSSYDEDTAPEDLKYKWRLIHNKYTNNNNIYQSVTFNSEIVKQEFVFKKIGIYKIGLTVSDGISRSREDTITVNVVERPVIYLSTIYKEYLFEESVFNRNSKKINDDLYFNISDKYNTEPTILLYNISNKLNADTSNYETTFSDYGEYLTEDREKVATFEIYKAATDRKASLELTIPKLYKDSLNVKTYGISFEGNQASYNSNIEIYAKKNKLTSERKKIHIKINTLASFDLGFDYDLINGSLYQKSYKIDSSGKFTADTNAIRYNFTLPYFTINLRLFKSLVFGASIIAPFKRSILLPPPTIYDNNVALKYDSLSAKYGAFTESINKTLFPIAKFCLSYPGWAFLRSFKVSPCLYYLVGLTLETGKLNSEVGFGIKFKYSLHTKKIPINLCYTTYAPITWYFGEHLISGLTVTFQPFLK